MNDTQAEVTARPVLAVRPVAGGYMVTLDVQADDFDADVPADVLDALTRWLNGHPGGFFVANS